MGNTTSALAKLAVKDLELIKAVRHAAGCKFWEFNVRDLGKTAWVVATLAVKDFELQKAVRHVTACKISERSPQGFAISVLTFATLERVGGVLLEATKDKLFQW